MENEHILRLIFFSFFLLTSIYATENGCRPASCGPTEPIIRFPFRLTGRQPFSCGYPGFDLSCDRRNQTIIRLPSSRSHIVNRINYVSQAIYIDPDFCKRKKLNGFNLTDTPFEFSSIRSYSFYNCTYQNFGFMYPAVPFPCLSGRNYSVIAVRTGLFSPENMPASCEIMKRIDVPVRWNGDIRSELELMWFTPACRGCEIEGRGCGLKNEDGEIGCIGSSRGKVSQSGDIKVHIFMHEVLLVLVVIIVEVFMWYVLPFVLGKIPKMFIVTVVWLSSVNLLVFI